jgi:tetratricopeptide (TPR) repeat protein
MNSVLPLIYLLIVTFILVLLVILLLKQILRKTETEQNLLQLQNKLRDKTATSLDYYLLGSIYLSKKLFDQAILQFRYAIKYWDKKDLDGLANLYNTIGFTYFQTNQYDLAIYYYTEAVKCLPNYITALNNLGYAYEKNQMMSNAKEIYSKVLEYDSGNKIASEKLEIILRRSSYRDDRI